MEQRLELISPLRYPGSKARLVNYIAGILLHNRLQGCTYYEPYAGGASVALGLLAQGLVRKVVIGEKDPLVYAFWRSVVDHPAELCSKIWTTDVNLDTWRNLQPLKSVKKVTKDNVLQLGYAGLFFNRTNFSGVIDAGPIGGMSQTSAYSIDCRFNKERLVEQITAISAFRSRISVKNKDCIEFLKMYQEKMNLNPSFVYLDPPYYVQGHRCYRYHYLSNDHNNLAKYITEQSYPWLVSYDSHPEIEKLYKGKGSQELFLDYSARVVRRGTELLISNLELPLPIYQMAKSPKKNTSYLPKICAVKTDAA